MNNVNFGSLDFGNMLNRRQNEWNQTLDGISRIGNAFNTYYDRRQAEEDRKRRWDSILELEKQGQDALDADQKYQDSIAEQEKLKGYIEAANDVNGRVDRAGKEYAEAVSNRGRILRSKERGAVVPEGAEYINNNGVEGYNFNDTEGKSHFAPMEGVRNGEYDGYGFVNGGSWANTVVDPYSTRIDRLGKLADDGNRINVDALKWKLGEEERKGLEYRKAGENAAMYRDPRYKAALATAKANNDPSVINQYYGQYASEEPMRQRNRTMEAIKNIPFNVDDKYGNMAKYLYNLSQVSQNPEDQEAYTTMLNGLITMKDQEFAARAEREREKTENDNLALDMNAFNNKNWTIADVGNKYRNVDINTLSKKELNALQDILRVKRSNVVNRATMDALKNAIEEGDKQNAELQRLFGIYGAYKVLGSINDSKRQKMLEEQLKFVQPQISGSGW